MNQQNQVQPVNENVVKLENLVGFFVGHKGFTDLANMDEADQFELAIAYLKTPAGALWRNSIIEVVYDQLNDLLEKERREIRESRAEAKSPNRFIRSA